MSVNVKLGNNTINGVDVVKLENADSAGNYIEFSPYASPPSTPTDAVIFYSLEPFKLQTYNKAKNWNGTLYYSTDYSTWSIWDGVQSVSAAQDNNYYKLYLKGSGNTYLTGGSISTKYWVFSGKGIKCCGNLNNLLDTTSPVLGNYAFCRLFYQNGNIDFDVTLPATTLTDYCYYQLFCNCESLTTAPALPATTLAQYCYGYMFGYCYSLATPPALPATTLADYCYSYMFTYCYELTTTPTLSATTLADYCYSYMFYNCRALTTVPALPAITLANYCYNYMFQGCSSIKLSTSKTGAYQTAYRIPTSGTGSTGTNSLRYMFTSTGGSFTGTPSINTTYYTSNTVIS